MAMNEEPNEEGGEMDEETEQDDLQDVTEHIQVDSLYGTAALAVESLCYRGDQFVIGMRAHSEISDDTLPDVVYQIMTTHVESVGVMLTAAQGRQLAAALLNASDEIDGLTLKRLQGGV